MPGKEKPRPIDRGLFWFTDQLKEVFDYSAQPLREGSITLSAIWMTSKHTVVPYGLAGIPLVGNCEAKVIHSSNARLT